MIPGPSPQKRPLADAESTLLYYARGAEVKGAAKTVAQSSQIAKVGHWHDRLIDALIAEPEIRLGELAKRFGVTQAWLSTVKNSDAFVDAYRRRSSEHSGALLGSVREKTLGAAEMAVDAISKRLEDTADVIPLPILLDTADVLLKRSGFGESKTAPTPNVNVQVGLVTQAQLEEARGRMRELKPEPGVIELQPDPGPTGLAGGRIGASAETEIQDPSRGGDPKEGPGS